MIAEFVAHGAAIVWNETSQYVNSSAEMAIYRYVSV